MENADADDDGEKIVMILAIILQKRVKLSFLTFVRNIFSLIYHISKYHLNDLKIFYFNNNHQI